MFEKKNVLVTGGAGFIGSHLCERLLREGGVRIICVDNISTGSIQNINDYLQNPDFQFIRADVTEPLHLEDRSELASYKIPFQGIQEIYHLACPTTITHFDEQKIATLRANAEGMTQTLEIANKYKSKVVFTSSSVVYGPRREDNPLTSENELGVVDHLTPRACYDEGKRFAETVCHTYRDVHKLDVRIARIFRTYGPRTPLHDGHLIPDFILNALDNKDLLVYEEGKFRTSLVYVTDIVDGLIRLMMAPKDLGPVNFGSDYEMNITEVIEKILTLTESSSKIVVGEDLLFLSELPVPDLTLAKESLGWIPLVRLEDGLNKTIEFMKANRRLLTLS